ncbi:MAG: IclR family transcriptional regulator [Terracidiphilus sp.]|nr:IclR family transcriptional regulator [Terracidiphilus sp.]MDR3776196.1 IclR family transcriptional regulator [Terracidiphilus sp.]
MTVDPLQKTTSKTRQTPSSVAENSPYFSRAVGKAFKLLDLVENSETPLSLNDLARQIRLTKSSTFRLLHTLESLRYLGRNEQGLYHRESNHTSKLLEYSLQKLKDAADGPMRKLSMEFRETISLAALMGNRIEVVEVIDSPHLVRMSNVVGRILPPHASSMGKAITAYQTPEVRERLLVSYGSTIFTPKTITDRRELEKYFEQIRATGISCDDEENTLGGFCYGIPIVQADNQVQSAISLSMPVTRLPQEQADRQKILDALHQAATEIAKALQ